MSDPVKGDDLPAFADLSEEDRDEVLAAELALGLIEGDEAQLVLARLAADAAFAERVHDWQERFSGMALGLVPMMPPARARQRIREELGHIAAPLSQLPDSRIHWWQRPGLLLAAVAALAVLAGLMLWR